MFQSGNFQSDGSGVTLRFVACYTAAAYECVLVRVHPTYFPV